MRIVRFLFLPLLSAAFASAQMESGVSLSFAHDALTCMSTSEFPLVEAEFEPEELSTLRKAQVYFKASRTEAWYFVDMEPGEGSKLRAMLPKPLPETDRVDYYLFFLSNTFEPAQTEQLAAVVSESGCGRAPETASSVASLTIRATVANQPPVPPGFSPQGISSLVTASGNTVAVGAAAMGGGASGGLSGAAIGAIAGGGAAAAAGVAVASGDDGDGGMDDITSSPDVGSSPEGGVTSSSPSPSPPPSPEPAPAPSVPDVSGTWLLNDRITMSCEPALVGRTSKTAMVIQQNGTALTASRNGPNYNENLTGTIDMAGNLSLRGPFADEGETGDAHWEATTTSGSEMTGRYWRFYPEHDCTIRWTFTGSKQP